MRNTQLWEDCATIEEKSSFATLFGSVLLEYWNFYHPLGLLPASLFMTLCFKGTGLRLNLPQPFIGPNMTFVSQQQ
jgi:hypothetical protein